MFNWGTSVEGEGGGGSDFGGMNMGDEGDDFGDFGGDFGGAYDFNIGDEITLDDAAMATDDPSMNEGLDTSGVDDGSGWESTGDANGDGFTDNGDGTFTDSEGNIIDQEGNALIDNGDGTYTYEDPGQREAALAGSQGGGPQFGGPGAPKPPKTPSAAKPSTPPKVTPQSGAAKPAAAPTKKPVVVDKNAGRYIAPVYSTQDRGTAVSGVNGSGDINARVRRATGSPGVAGSGLVMGLPPYVLAGAFVLTLFALRR